MKKYEDITGFVSFDELEEATTIDEVAGGITAVACAAATFVAVVASAVGCPSGACTGYC